MFEKIAKDAFMDELEKIAFEFTNPYASKKPTPPSDEIIKAKQKINYGTRPIRHNRSVPMQNTSKIKAVAGAIGKRVNPIVGALALSGLAFGAGSAMAANSGAGAV